jgi:hypothetical protein
LAHANILRAHPTFYGAGFSTGDQFIEAKGLYFNEYMQALSQNPKKRVGGTGNAEQWLRAGINHHIAVVVDQIAKLGA